MSPTTRRRFLASMTASMSLVTASGVSLGAAAQSREIGFKHLHTGERLVLEYFSGGRYIPESLEAINRLLRDFRSGEAGMMDPALLDLLHELKRLTGTTQPFEIISGYRSATTNAELRRRSAAVASRSLHMTGRAVDIRLADVPLARLRDAALSLGRGGVGYYAGSNFVHVDTGRVRAW